MSAQPIDYEAMAYTIADEARAYFTDESIARVVACGEKGLWTWAEVYDEICGAISRKERRPAVIADTVSASAAAIARVEEVMRLR